MRISHQLLLLLVASSIDAVIGSSSSKQCSIKRISINETAKVIDLDDGGMQIKCMKGYLINGQQSVFIPCVKNLTAEQRNQTAVDCQTLDCGLSPSAGNSYSLSNGTNGPSFTVTTNNIKCEIYECIEAGEWKKESCKGVEIIEIKDSIGETLWSLIKDHPFYTGICAIGATILIGVIVHIIKRCKKCCDSPSRKYKTENYKTETLTNIEGGKQKAAWNQNGKVQESSRKPIRARSVSLPSPFASRPLPAHPKRLSSHFYNKVDDGYAQQSAPPQSTPPQSAPPQSAPPQSAPPQSAPPQSAPPQSAPPQSTPPEFIKNLRQHVTKVDSTASNDELPYEGPWWDNLEHRDWKRSSCSKRLAAISKELIRKQSSERQSENSYGEEYEVMAKSFLPDVVQFTRKDSVESGSSYNSSTPSATSSNSTVINVDECESEDDLPYEGPWLENGIEFKLKCEKKTTDLKFTEDADSIYLGNFGRKLEYLIVHSNSSKPPSKVIFELI